MEEVVRYFVWEKMFQRLFIGNLGNELEGIKVETDESGTQNLTIEPYNFVQDILLSVTGQVNTIETELCLVLSKDKISTGLSNKVSYKN